MRTPIQGSDLWCGAYPFFVLSEETSSLKNTVVSGSCRSGSATPVPRRGFVLFVAFCELPTS